MTLRQTILLLGLGAMAACDNAAAPRTGSLALSITGLPPGVAASVSITGANRTLHATASQTFSDLDPGTYQISAANAASDKSTFAPASVSTTIEVTAGDSPAQATVNYLVTTAIAAVNITGIPAGLTPSVVFTGSNGFSRTLTASGEIGNLPPGAYTVSAPLLDGDELYAGTVEPSSVTLTASTTPVVISVAYAPITGTIRFSHSGLPAGASPVWDVSGPSGFTRTVGANETSVSKLLPGQYVVTSRNVSFESESYGPTGAPVTVTVGAGQAANVTMTFAPRPPTLNLKIEGAYLTQAVQTFGGAVPLVAGRDAFIRVFARANELNSVRPNVRLRIFQNGALITTRLIASARPDVPTAVSEQAVSDSWNTTISGVLVQPGMSYVVDIDPENAAREVDETDNQFPASGTPVNLDVRAVPQVNLRFVPIVTGDGVVGDVSQERIAELINITLRMHPVNAISTELRAPFNTARTLVRNDSNNAWSRILSEIETLRVAEGQGRQYVGILKDNAGTGIAGIAFLNAASAVSFDGPSATETIAHELGHNWSRRHSPCGGPSGVDTQYPYVGGKIGVFGFDLTSSRVLTPDVPDVMSYCWLPIAFNIATPRRWASDYTYNGVMNYRSAFGDEVGGNAAAPSVDCLIVWGRVTPTGLVLEPAFVSRTQPKLPLRGGTLRLQARDAGGGSLMNLSFNPLETADARSTEEHFAFAIPLSQVPAAAIASLELSGRGLAPAVRLATRDMDDAHVSMSSDASQSLRLRWDAKRAPILVVRDRTTNEILSFARDGDAVIRTRGSQLDVSASNGVRPIRVTIDSRN